MNSYLEVASFISDKIQEGKTKLKHFYRLLWVTPKLPSMDLYSVSGKLKEFLDQTEIP